VFALAKRNVLALLRSCKQRGNGLRHDTKLIQYRLALSITFLAPAGLSFFLEIELLCRRQGTLPHILLYCIVLRCIVLQPWLATKGYLKRTHSAPGPIQRILFSPGQPCDVMTKLLTEKEIKRQLYAFISSLLLYDHFPLVRTMYSIPYI